MNRSHLQTTLKAYLSVWKRSDLFLGAPVGWAVEQAKVKLFTDLLRSTPHCFQRSCVPAHFTASALVVSPDHQQVLLTLHAKKQRWLPLGGHPEAEARMDQTARREISEESGLSDVSFEPYAAQLLPSMYHQHEPLPFDLAVHSIAAQVLQPAHCHYDVVYLVVADPQAPLCISDESQDLRWFNLAAARTLANDGASARLFKKLHWLDHTVAARRHHKAVARVYGG